MEDQFPLSALENKIVYLPDSELKHIYWEKYGLQVVRNLLLMRSCAPIFVVGATEVISWGDGPMFDDIAPAGYTVRRQFGSNLGCAIVSVLCKDLFAAVYPTPQGAVFVAVRRSASNVCEVIGRQANVLGDGTRLNGKKWLGLKNKDVVATLRDRSRNAADRPKSDPSLAFASPSTAAAAAVIDDTEASSSGGVWSTDQLLRLRGVLLQHNLPIDSTAGYRSARTESLQNTVLELMRSVRPNITWASIVTAVTKGKLTDLPDAAEAAPPLPAAAAAAVESTARLSLGQRIDALVGSGRLKSDGFLHGYLNEIVEFGEADDIRHKHYQSATLNMFASVYLAGGPQAIEILRGPMFAELQAERARSLTQRVKEVMTACPREVPRGGGRRSNDETDLQAARKGILREILADSYEDSLAETIRSKS